MRRVGCIPLFLALASFLGPMHGLAQTPLPSGFPDPDQEQLMERLGLRLEGGGEVGRIAAAGRTLMGDDTILEFYRSRLFRPAWMEDGDLSARGREVLAQVQGIRSHGLRPEDYHLPLLDSLLQQWGVGGEAEVRRRVDVDLLLSDAFLLLATHLQWGRVDSDSRRPRWVPGGDGMDMMQLLHDGVEGMGPTRVVESLLPEEAGYDALRQELNRLRQLAFRGGWARIEPGELLEEGMRHPRVAQLRSRLEASGELPSTANRGATWEGEGGWDPHYFDASISRAVRLFQERQGLESDGRVGALTLAAMNISLDYRISQVEINLERWRWLPPSLGRRHIAVNTADFSVEVVEDGEAVLRMRSIVGRGYRQTPAFSSEMTYLVLSPYWHVPPGIAAADVFPRLQSDPGYLRANRMIVLEQATNRRVDPGSVDWLAMTSQEFNRTYRVRQDPGPWNSLGQVKFMFPNRHNVYLHDTPARDLFRQNVRDFSSGCIRIEDPLELAAYLLQGDPSWNTERMKAVVDEGMERNVPLPEAISVHIHYWTAWVDREGVLQFRTDLYQRDLPVRRALDQDPPLA
ncbi:MAG: L,D-transpeptidase family protein [Gemmatimonadota bacterium]